MQALHSGTVPDMLKVMGKCGGPKKFTNSSSINSSSPPTPPREIRNPGPVAETFRENRRNPDDPRPQNHLTAKVGVKQVCPQVRDFPRGGKFNGLHA
jgi:hypothetical protein